MRLIGGRIALDFLNTADWSDDGEVVVEKLAGETDVLLWASAIGARRCRIEPASVLREFRRKLRPAFTGDSGVREAARIINDVLIAMDQNVLSYSKSRRLRIHENLALTQLIALSAAAVLTDFRDAPRIKVCPGKNCGWLFLDETKNGRRRWCTMETCGNRAKARRSYERRS